MNKSGEKRAKEIAKIMVNYYKPKYKKWLRNEKLIFGEKSSKFDKLERKKWQGFKAKNRNPSLQAVVTFEERLRMESEKVFIRSR